MKRITALVILAMTAAIQPSYAVNKCTGPDGKVVFQDAVCEGKGETLRVRPASGASRAGPPSSAPSEAQVAAKQQTEAQRIEAKVLESQKERRRIELEVRLVPNAEGEIHRHRAACDRDLKALQEKKNLANNNLAGATWEGSISGEMSALATRCDTRNRELRDDASALRAECKQLGGCK